MVPSLQHTYKKSNKVIEGGLGR